MDDGYELMLDDEIIVNVNKLIYKLVHKLIYKLIHKLIHKLYISEAK